MAIKRAVHPKSSTANPQGVENSQQDSLELRNDAQIRFEKAVDAAVKSPPLGRAKVIRGHRTASKRA